MERLPARSPWAGRPRASCRRPARPAGRPSAAARAAISLLEVDAGAHAHGLEHEHQVFGDHVARRARRVRAAAEAAERRSRRCARRRRTPPGNWPGPRPRVLCMWAAPALSPISARRRLKQAPHLRRDWRSRWCRTGPTRRRRRRRTARPARSRRPPAPRPAACSRRRSRCRPRSCTCGARLVAQRHDARAPRRPSARASCARWPANARRWPTPEW